MDSKLSFFIEIENKLDIIEKDIDENQWEKLPEKFLEIKEIKKKIDSENSNKDKKSDQDLKSHRDKIILKIDLLEQKIINWKENQKKKIEKLKKNESHLNGYKKQPKRSYYIDKSE